MTRCLGNVEVSTDSIGITTQDSGGKENVYRRAKLSSHGAPMACKEEELIVQFGAGGKPTE